MKARETDTGAHLRPRDDLASAVLDAFVGPSQPGIRDHQQAVWRGRCQEHRHGGLCERSRSDFIREQPHFSHNLVVLEARSFARIVVTH
jgi:hypothetical protein